MIYWIDPDELYLISLIVWIIHDVIERSLTGDTYLGVGCMMFGLMFPVRNLGCLCGLTGSVLDHRSLPPQFESHYGHIWRVFHLWIRFIILGGRSAHLAFHVHKGGRKTPVVILVRDFNLVKASSRTWIKDTQISMSVGVCVSEWVSV